MTTKHWKSRLGGRGVAMVEAGILAPIFAMMMMMTIYLMGTYEAKYRTCMLSRYAAWSFASNACSDDEFKPITSDLPPGIKLGPVSGDSKGPATQQQDKTGGAPGNPQTDKAEGGDSASKALFMGHGQSTLTWDYQPTYKFHSGGAKTVTTESQVVCNTPKPVGQNIFSYLGSIISSVL